jgi:Resolvase, N terminal domain
VTGRRRRRAGGELWSAADRRTLAYVRLGDARGVDLPRHIDAIERLCEARGLELADIVVDVEGGAESTSAPPGLTWALERLAAGAARALAVARTEHVTGAFAEAAGLRRWFREQGLKLVAADASAAEEGAPDPPGRALRRVRRAPGVGPGSWARYVHARTDDGRLPNR